MPTRHRPGSAAARAEPPTYPQKDTQNTPARPLRKGSVSLAVAEPEMARQWDPEANGDWTPGAIAQKSNLYAWWVCASGHRWRTRVNNRVAGRLGCPECVEAGEAPPKASLSVTHPLVAAQWHPTKNRRLRPEGVVASSTRRVWWRCAREHVWQASVHSRSTTRSGCPECAAGGASFVDGMSKPDSGLRQDSMALTHPDLAAEWDTEANGSLAVDVSVRSDIHRWWSCQVCDHRWRESPAARTSGGGCPACYASRKAANGGKHLPLASRYPGLVKMWDSKKNGAPASRAFPVLGKRLYWWKCAEGHAWQQGLQYRHRYGDRCPVCSGRHLVTGVNDLATTNPAAAALWHPDLNGALGPEDVSGGSRTKAWWMCEEGHAWRAEIRSWKGGRVGYAGCTVCRDMARARRQDEAEEASTRSRMAYKGRSVTHPIPGWLAAQWHPARNVDWPGGPATASVVSRRSAWWLCGCGHEWLESVKKRTQIAGSRCPACGQSPEPALPEGLGSAPGGGFLGPLHGPPPDPGPYEALIERVRLARSQPPEPLPENKNDHPLDALMAAGLREALGNRLFRMGLRTPEEVALLMSRGVPGAGGGIGSNGGRKINHALERWAQDVKAEADRTARS